MAGYAGTGKSTISREIAKQVKGTVFCAYTGKAAKVLRDKGVGKADTIHHFLYAYIGKDENGDPVFGYDPSELLSQKWLVVVDEYSMISKQIFDDLISTGNKILFLGDPFQLPPIKNDKEEKDFIKPDIFLEHVHRQALDSPILRAATEVREGKKLFHRNEGDFIYASGLDYRVMDFLNVDQVICGTNNTRRKINEEMRQALGFSGKTICEGEKLICLKNDRKEGLLNGMIGTAKNICHTRDYYCFDFLCDGKIFQGIKVWTGDIEGADPKTYNYKSGLHRFDYGYCITCHKSQGSEFPEVIIMNEPFGTPMDQQRWLYTAITRGKNQVTLLDF